MLKLNLLRRYHNRKISEETGIYFGQPPILELLDECGSMTQKEIAEKLHVSAPSIATSVKRMSKTELLEKQSTSSDMRCTTISLTEKGRKAHERCKKKFDEFDALTLKGLSVSQREELSLLLDIMMENLSTEDIDGKSVFEIIDEMKVDKKECSD